MSQTTTVGINGTTSHSTTDTSTNTTIRSTNASIGPLLKMARVEIQAIMQFLPRAELLRFSRCSRTLLADGDSDVVWKYQPLYEADFAEFLDCDHFRPTSLFMRRQRGFGLGGRTNFTGVNSQFILTLLDTVPRIKRFTILTGSFIPSGDWKKLLEHSGLNQVRELYLRCGCFELTSIFLSSIERLTHLTALTLPSKIGHDSIVGLRAFPELTFLGVSQDAQREDSKDSISTALVDCEVNLTSLHIGSPALRLEQFFSIFSSPNLSKLKKLSLLQWQWFDGYIDEAGDLQDRFRNIWKQMTNLDGLILSEIPRISSIIPTLTSAPSLKELVFGLPSYVDQLSLPDMDQLSALLLHSSHLCVTISTNGERLAESYDSLHAAFPTRAYRVLHPDLAIYDEWTSTPSLMFSAQSIAYCEF